MYTKLANQNYFKTKFSKFKLVPNTRLTASRPIVHHARIALVYQCHCGSNINIGRISLAPASWLPEESQRVDDLLNEILPYSNQIKNDLDEFATSYRTPTFERKEPLKGVDVLEDNTSAVSPLDEKAKAHSDDIPLNSLRPKNLNDKLNKGMQIGLNDKLAFIKHLFDEQTEDYTRVLSQISTMKSFDEAANFISSKIKPDYNHWENKDEYSKRFMDIIQKGFS